MWSAAHGWETNKDIPIYGDPAAKKGGSMSYAFQEFGQHYGGFGKDLPFQIVSVIFQVWFTKPY